MMMPYFDYADIYYDACIHPSLTRLQRLQNRALRVIFGREHVNLSTADMNDLIYPV